MKYLDVILPLPLKGTFTYRVSGDGVALVQVGMRVLLPFGKSKLYSGIIKEVHQRKPEKFEAREIISILDEKPLVSEMQLMFWKWIADYYMCSIGEVMNAALPGGLKLSSETVFELNEGEIDWGKLDDNEVRVLEFLQHEQKVSLDELRKGPLGDQGIRWMKRLEEKGVVHTDQYFRKAYKAKKIVCIELVETYRDEGALFSLLEGLSRAKAQVKGIEEYLKLSGKYDDPPQEKEVLRTNLTNAGVTSATIQTLVKKGIFFLKEIATSRIYLGDEGGETEEVYPLSDAQDKAFKEVKKLHKKLPVVLLHGVTSSGKTEVYIHMIKECIARGEQVLYLLPEIALTSQIIGRLKRNFGEEVGIFHSKYSDNERVEVYRNMAGLTDRKPYSVILGVRSALFLPFKKLGLIVVDEEHENTYKQHDPAPRYHARDAATIMGMYLGAKLIFGSATPSFESLHNAEIGKYGLVDLRQRYGDVAMPEVVIADVKQAKKRKQLKSHFTPELLGAMKESLDDGKQVILFQNRRGFSNYLICDTCNTIVKCKSCDVSLTYHKFSNEMHCHYCGFKTHVYADCPECGDHALTMRGFGTEKIEDEIGQFFPDARVGRLDIDKMSSRKSFDKLIRDFESGRVQILVGTQLVTKGLDFENVNLVGILDADSMLNFPDFRAFERSYQLMVQVSGRAGRRAQRGKVIVQTGDPTHPVIEHVLNGSFRKFYEEQTAERSLFRYPPFYRLLKITMRHEIPSILDGGAKFLADELKVIFGGRVLGPQQPMIGKTHNLFIKQIMLKVEKDASFERAKKLTQDLLDVFVLNPVYKKIRLTIDVDPM